MRNRWRAMAIGASLVASCLVLAGPAAAVPGGGQDDKVGGDYVVQPGDTLSQIAVDQGIEGGHQQLYDQNDDVLTDADTIYAGQRLAVKTTAPRRADGAFSPLVTPGIPDLTAEQLAPQPLPTTFPGAVAAAPWVVSLGDSFISGEAGRWAGNTDGNSDATDALGGTAYFDSPMGDRELIPLCHRSKSAMIHIGDDGSPTVKGTPVNSLNLACSGAQTETFTESGAFKPGLDFFNDGPGEQGQAYMLQEFAQNNDVRMVVVSIGGNDFGFASVIQTCVEDFLVYFSYCSQDPNVTSKASAANVKAVSAKITTALQNVHKAMQNAGKSDGSWTLVFNLNPDPMVQGDGFRYGEHVSRQDTGGCGVYNIDATWAGTTFLGAVRQAQQEAVQAAGIPGAVLMDLGNWVDGRQLCSTTTALVGSGAAPTWQTPGAVDISEWANQIHTDTVTGPYFEQESLHPNYWAQLGARSCLRQAYHSGSPTGGTCVRTGDGLTSRGEPVMAVT